MDMICRMRGSLRTGHTERATEENFIVPGGSITEVKEETFQKLERETVVSNALSKIQAERWPLNVAVRSLVMLEVSVVRGVTSVQCSYSEK